MLDGLQVSPRIEAKRIALRQPMKRDAGLASLYLGDERVARDLASMPHPFPPGAAEALIDRALDGGRSGPFYVMDASPSGGPEVVGFVFVNAAGEAGDYSVAFAVAPPFWNAGYATEAVAAVCAHLFKAGAKALVAEVFHDDAASARLLSRLGFAYMGDGEAWSGVRGGAAPVWRYRLERAEAKD